MRWLLYTCCLIVGTGACGDDKVAPGLADCGPDVHQHSSPFCLHPDPVSGLPVAGCWDDVGAPRVACTHEALVSPSSPETVTVLCDVVCPVVRDLLSSTSWAADDGRCVVAFRFGAVNDYQQLAGCRGTDGVLEVATSSGSYAMPDYGHLTILPLLASCLQPTGETSTTAIAVSPHDGSPRTLVASSPPGGTLTLAETTVDFWAGSRLSCLPHAALAVEP